MGKGGYGGGYGGDIKGGILGERLYDQLQLLKGKNSPPYYHPQNLTKLKMDRKKSWLQNGIFLAFIFHQFLFRFHIKLQQCNLPKHSAMYKAVLQECPGQIDKLI